MTMMELIHLVYGIYDEMRTGFLVEQLVGKLFEYSDILTDYHNDWDNSMGDPVPFGK